MDGPNRPNKGTVRFYLCSGDLHVVPYLDDALRRIGRVKTGSSGDPEDSEIFREVESLSYRRVLEQGLDWDVSSVGRPLYRRVLEQSLELQDTPMTKGETEGAGKQVYWCVGNEYPTLSK